MAEANTEVAKQPNAEEKQASAEEKQPAQTAPKGLAVDVPQTARHSEAKQPALNCIIFLIISTLLIIPRMFKFKTILTGTAGTYLVYKNMFPSLEDIGGSGDRSASAMNWVDLIVLVGIAVVSCFKTVGIFTASLSFGYTFAYFVTVIFDINQLSVFLLIMFFATAIQLLLYEIKGLAAMSISHIFLAAYMMLSLVNIELFDILGGLHHSEDLTSVGKLMRKGFLVCLLVAAGGASLAFHSLLGTEKEEQIKAEGKKMLKKAADEVHLEEGEIVIEGAEKNDKKPDEENVNEEKDTQADNTGGDNGNSETVKDEPEAKTEGPDAEKGSGSNTGHDTTNDGAGKENE